MLPLQTLGHPVNLGETISIDVSAITAILFVASAIVFGILYAVLHATQGASEPQLTPILIPFFDSAIGIARHKVDYLVSLRKRYGLPIHTLRMPFQRIYVINAPHLIKAVQSRSNLNTFVPTLLDFGMLFSGLGQKSKETLTRAYGAHGNGFTKSVHTYLASGPDLNDATLTAVEKLTEGLRGHSVPSEEVGLYNMLRHELCMALTAAIYGPENPYNDPAIEASWLEFVPGISHLLYSPFPSLTARKALKARARVIEAFQNYFSSGGHMHAFPMIPDMFKTNVDHGLSSLEAAKLEMATSLAMLSSGAISAFWLMFHIASDPEALRECRHELDKLAVQEASEPSRNAKVVDMSNVKTQCPTLMAMWHETLRYHSTVINIKKVQHDTTLSSQYFLKKGAIIMIPGTAVHHDTTTWGSGASQFDHKRFLKTETRTKLSNSTAYRPFGAGTTMCPGRHFSTSVVLSLVAMMILQFDIVPTEGQWYMPSKKNADMWNAMPKPDQDVPVRFFPRRQRDASHAEWRFVWGAASKRND